MSQTTRPQSPWQPPQSQDSPMPPAKRQRLSPNPASPYAHSSTPYAGSPTYNNISIPQGTFPARSNGMIAQDPSARPQQGAMGPPQRPTDRPVEKPTQKGERPQDPNDLTDIVTSSGISLKDEEDFLVRSYGSGFNRSDAPIYSSARPNPTYDLLSRDNLNNHGASRSTFHQPRPQKSEEEELEERHGKAARQINEAKQWHLSNPFLWGASLRQKMQTIARENGLSIPIEGLFDRISDKPTGMSGQKMQGQDGGVQVTKAPSLLHKDMPMEPILTLLSLSTNERLRTLMEDAYGLARARQLGSDGVVPSQWADLAAGEGGEPTKVNSDTVTGTSWEKNGAIEESGSQPNGSSGNGPRSSQDPQPTVAFTKNTTNNALSALIKEDRQREVERLKRRAARRTKKAEKAAVAATAPASQSPTETGTPAPEASVPPTAPKQTKKERETAARKEKDLSDEAQAQAANATANMQLGGKQYSWMNKGGATKPAPKPAVRPGGSAAAAQKKKEGLDAIEDRTYDTWRENGVGGKGMQLRDIIRVLEMDGRERKTLQWSYTMLEDGLQVSGNRPPVPPSAQPQNHIKTENNQSPAPSRQNSYISPAQSPLQSNPLHQRPLQQPYQPNGIGPR